jgi:hypothetical protein
MTSEPTARRSRSSSPALPIAFITLRILIVANWVMLGAILVLLVAMPNEAWILSAFKLSASPDADRVVNGLRAIAVMGLAVVPLNYAVLKHLLAIVRTVREGNPFVAMNALRLRTIAWSLLMLQLLGAVISIIARSISSPAHEVRIETGLSMAGWLAVVLTFVLARVFAVGIAMREDLEGTV